MDDIIRMSQVIDMFEPSSSKIGLLNSNSNTNLGSITSHKIVFTPNEVYFSDDVVSVIHIKSIKFSPADYNKKSVKNLLCGELLYRIKRYLCRNEKISIDRLIKDFNNKFEHIVTLVSIESIDAFLQNKLEYEQLENNTHNKKRPKTNIDQSCKFGL